MRITVHGEPVLRGETDWVARIALEPFGFEGEWEQVWLRRMEGDLAEVCCVPLRAYGVGLRDVVRLSADGSTVVEVVERSGRHVFRALLVDERDEEVAEIAAEVEAICARTGLLLEWTNGRLVAIDIPPEAEATDVLNYLSEYAQAGRLEWEWSDMVPFEAPPGERRRRSPSSVRLRRFGRG
jgi:hypothetical protein